MVGCRCDVFEDLCEDPDLLIIPVWCAAKLGLLWLERCHRLAAVDYAGR